VVSIQSQAWINWWYRNQNCWCQSLLIIRLEDVMVQKPWYVKKPFGTSKKLWYVKKTEYSPLRVPLRVFLLGPHDPIQSLSLL
jgi:hypothetical protein